MGVQRMEVGVWVAEEGDGMAFDVGGGTLSEKGVGDEEPEGSSVLMEAPSLRLHFGQKHMPPLYRSKHPFFVVCQKLVLRWGIELNSSSSEERPREI